LRYTRLKIALIVAPVAGLRSVSLKWIQAIKAGVARCGAKEKE
jgi:hypothetical protein